MAALHRVVSLFSPPLLKRFWVVKPQLMALDQNDCSVSVLPSKSSHAGARHGQNRHVYRVTPFPRTRKPWLPFVYVYGILDFAALVLMYVVSYIPVHSHGRGAWVGAVFCCYCVNGWVQCTTLMMIRSCIWMLHKVVVFPDVSFFHLLVGPGKTFRKQRSPRLVADVRHYVHSLRVPKTWWHVRVCGCILLNHEPFRT